jgi:hypothetical protein
LNSLNTDFKYALKKSTAGYGEIKRTRTVNAKHFSKGKSAVLTPEIYLRD